ncbi:hypothetical protein CEXT_636081 [Caerostris extrusa]|uniref:Uncharacterized protein n=1 Tax=Caerostris extrusa TaxID=172846 RepID=A0AAV4V9B1_CAEEX|nr:hypothetical protein CEXT_636081 [Caerostris extrusa]
MLELCSHWTGGFRKRDVENIAAKRDCFEAFVRDEETRFFAVTMTSEKSAFPDSHWLAPSDDLPNMEREFSETFIHELACVKDE